jgi:hypothetical protein
MIIHICILYIYIYYMYIYIYICILLESIKYLQKTCRHMDQPPPGPCAWSSREGGPVAWRWLVAWCSCQADRYLPIQSPGEGRELWSYGSLMFLSQGHPRTEFTQWWLGLLEWHSEKQTIFWEKSWTWTLAPLEIGACQTSFLLPLLGFFQRLSLIWWIIAYYTYMMPCASIFGYFQCFLGWDGWNRPHNNILKVVSFLWGQGIRKPATQALRFEFWKEDLKWRQARSRQARHNDTTGPSWLKPAVTMLQMFVFSLPKFGKTVVE